MYEIEKNIPMRSRSEGRYPFKDMKKDDSFFVPMDEGETLDKLRNRVYSSIKNYELRNNGEKFATRKTDGGLRVWRTK